MGISTNGQICYGIKFDAGYEFPWNDEQWDDIDNWWLFGVCGYKNPFEMFDNSGSWIGGKKWPEEKIREYYDTRRGFEKDHPLPVKLVNYRHIDYPMIIIAIPRTCLTARRGYPESFEPSTLAVNDEERGTLIAFCETHKIEHSEEPRWWLSSYWS